MNSPIHDAMIFHCQFAEQTTLEQLQEYWDAIKHGSDPQLASAGGRIMLRLQVLAAVLIHSRLLSRQLLGQADDELLMAVVRRAEAALNLIQTADPIQAKLWTAISNSPISDDPFEAPSEEDDDHPDRENPEEVAF